MTRRPGDVSLKFHGVDDTVGETDRTTGDGQGEGPHLGTRTVREKISRGCRRYRRSCVRYESRTMGRRKGTEGEVKRGTFEVQRRFSLLTRDPRGRLKVRRHRSECFKGRVGLSRDTVEKTF